MAEGVEARAVVVQDDEALHVHPFLQNRGQQLPQVVPTEGRRVIVVVVRNEAAHRHAGVQIEQRQHRLQHRPAHVLEVHVDAIRAGHG